MEMPLTRFLLDRAPELWERTVEHLFLTGLSTAVAILLGIPLGLWILGQARLRGPILGAASVLQTIPSLAMLAILLPFLGIGVRPAIVALTLYALLPIVRNTYTGLKNVSPDLNEAAQALGFTRVQRLLMVELPLALPVVVAGIRTAAVIGVGIATLSAFIGAGGLGDFINRGLALSDLRLVMLGAVPAGILALLIDHAIGVVEVWLRPGRRPPRLVAKTWVFGLLLVVLATGFTWLSRGAAASGQANSGTAGTIRIGSKNFTEQLILGEVMAQLIEARTELRVVRRFNLGGSIICHKALVRGGIDLYPEYTGTALTAILNLEILSSPDEVYRVVSRTYRERFDCEWLEPLGFNNTYVVAVRRSDALKRGWSSISDLRDDAGGLKAGFTAEFLERPDGYPGLKVAYGFDFDNIVTLESGLMYRAIAQGELDIIGAFATDGRIRAFDLAALVDDRGFFPPYHAAPVVRRDSLRAHPELGRVLNALAGRLTDEKMRDLNYRVDESRQAPADVAREFLVTEGLLSEGGSI